MEKISRSLEGSCPFRGCHNGTTSFTLATTPAGQCWELFSASWYLLCFQMEPCLPEENHRPSSLYSNLKSPSLFVAARSEVQFKGCPTHWHPLFSALFGVNLNEWLCFREVMITDQVGNLISAQNLWQLNQVHYFQFYTWILYILFHLHNH